MATTLLVILIVLLAIGALVSLVRGVILFMQQQREDVLNGTEVNVSGLRQNRMMWRRIQFQAAAVLAAALLLFISRS
ncbi:HIG1 domain-containing protein [Sphingomonas naphthae]|uniref:HIG1 domain-containing protein n=1 Tax=Sphingomonas naphthae TaxID=1813468 RepID=A0ABY7TJK3_9SPHN|nr:HIG1 domain-containing protein [Sphingomonas naphthae]WCT73339.1 HIG1 domain-containing protein [Sphingomonas naphthae]